MRKPYYVSSERRYKQVIDFLRATGECTIAQAAEALGISVDYSRNILRRMAVAGQIEREEVKFLWIYKLGDRNHAQKRER